MVIIEKILIFGPRIGIHAHIIFHSSSASCYTIFDRSGRNRGKMMVELICKGTDYSCGSLRINDTF